MLLVLPLRLLASDSSPQPAAPPSPANLEWWREARFGMFVHWGPVSLKGTEIGWSRGAEVPEAEYDRLFRHFNPTRFDGRAWARTAKAAGMKYLVLTSKHHDGFCLWDSQYTDYDVMNTPFGRDVIRELSAACRKEGIVFCTYHSICDWWHPDYPLGSPGGKSQKPAPNMDRYNAYLKGQLTELIRNYGPLGILWFDGEWESPWNPDRALDLYQHCRRLQDSIIINNRVGKGRQDMAGTTAGGAFAGDYDTPEQRVGKFQNDRPWESCITICQQWAWKPDDQLKSLRECLQTLVTCAGGDGNLLLNVGPMPDGRIEPRQVERLREMGRWLKRYGKSLYATRGGPYKPGAWGASTRRGGRIYLHVFRWPDGGLRLPAIDRKITSARALTGGRVQLEQGGDRVLVSVSAGHRQPIDTVIELRLDGPAATIAPRQVGGTSSSTGKEASASNVFQNDTGYGAGMACDGDAATRWATDAGTRQAWIEVDLGKPETFSRVVVDEWQDGGKRIQSFELQYHDGDGWKTFCRGTTIGSEREYKFPGVTARRVRLNILDATEGPTLTEFSIFRE